MDRRLNSCVDFIFQASFSGRFTFDPGFVRESMQTKLRLSSYYRCLLSTYNPLPIHAVTERRGMRFACLTSDLLRFVRF